MPNDDSTDTCLYSANTTLLCERNGHIRVLKLNGLTLDADESTFESLVLKTTQGQIDKSAIVEFFRKYSHQ